MAIKLKCKIKSMRIEEVKNKKSNKVNILNNYFVEIIGTDNATVCNAQYCMALNSNQIVKIVGTPIKASANSAIFNFISAHSRDNFIMELEKGSDKGNEHNKDERNKDDSAEIEQLDNKGYFIKSAEVIYG